MNSPDFSDLKINKRYRVLPAQSRTGARASKMGRTSRSGGLGSRQRMARLPNCPETDSHDPMGLRSMGVRNDVPNPVAKCPWPRHGDRHMAARSAMFAPG